MSKNKVKEDTKTEPEAKPEEKVEEKVEEKPKGRSGNKEKARRQFIMDDVIRCNPTKYLPRKAELEAWVKAAKDNE